MKRMQICALPKIKTRLVTSEIKITIYLTQSPIPKSCTLFHTSCMHNVEFYLPRRRGEKSKSHPVRDAKPFSRHFRICSRSNSCFEASLWQVGIYFSSQPPRPPLTLKSRHIPTDHNELKVYRSGRNNKRPRKEQRRAWQKEAGNKNHKRIVTHLLPVFKVWTGKSNTRPVRTRQFTNGYAEECEYKHEGNTGVFCTLIKIGVRCGMPVCFGGNYCSQKPPFITYLHRTATMQGALKPER